MNLNSYLDKKHKDAGLSLSDDNGLVVLKKGKDEIGHWNKNVTFEEIHDFANQWIAGITFDTKQEPIT